MENKNNNLISIVIAMVIWTILILFGVGVKFLVMYITFGLIVSIIHYAISLISEDLHGYEQEEMTLIKFFDCIFRWPIVLIETLKNNKDKYLEEINQQMDKVRRERLSILLHMYDMMLSHWDINGKDIPIKEGEKEEYILTLYEIRKNLRVMFNLDHDAEKIWLRRTNDEFGVAPMSIIFSGVLFRLKELSESLIKKNQDH